MHILNSLFRANLFRKIDFLLKKEFFLVFMLKVFGYVEKK